MAVTLLSPFAPRFLVRGLVKILEMPRREIAMSEGMVVSESGEVEGRRRRRRWNQNHGSAFGPRAS